MTLILALSFKIVLVVGVNEQGYSSLKIYLLSRTTKLHTVLLRLVNLLRDCGISFSLVVDYVIFVSPLNRQL